MSIWSSWDHIGTDPGDEHPERGTVLTYAEGFSNHYPDTTGTHERPAVLEVAHIAPWCTPGWDEAGCSEPDQCGEWLRLQVYAQETLNFWSRDEHGNPEVVKDHAATVVLDVRAATALRDDLNAWLSRDHLTPKETP